VSAESLVARSSIDARAHDGRTRGRPAGTRDEVDRPTRTVELAVVRALHSGIFLVELGAILWLLVTGLVGRRDRTVALAGGLVAAEAAVFVANSGVCPLTPLAERLGARRGSVSDIFLPDAIARTIPIWSSVLVGLGVALHVRRLAREGRLRA
jgi:hypothetical protein